MNRSTSQHPKRNLSFQISNRLLVGLAIAFLIAASLTAYLTFQTVRSLVSSWNLQHLSPFALIQPGDHPPQETPLDLFAPLQPATGPTPQPWDETSRVTILVLGLDYRDWENNQGAPRTDTMMLLTLDPLSNTAGMLSIPRDLWVNIPGFQPNKINTAYRFGEIYRLPEGGPGLAIKTVEQLLGIPIHFYAQVDFFAFERFIDELGGIEVEVPEELKVDPIGPGNTVVLEPGRQTLDGAVALAYARARNTEGSDFDRAQRQQQVVLAIRDRVLSLDMLPTLISKAPLLYQELAAGVQTNLSLDQAIKLALMASQIPEGNIHRAQIGVNQVAFGTSPDGQDILIPIPEEIRLVRDQVFSSGLLGSPVAVATDPAQVIAAEGARVAVLNGTLTPG